VVNVAASRKVVRQGISYLLVRRASSAQLRNLVAARPSLPAAVRRRRVPSPVVLKPCGEEIKRRQKHLSMLLLLLLQGIRASCALPLCLLDA